MAMSGGPVGYPGPAAVPPAMVGPLRVEAPPVALSLAWGQPILCLNHLAAGGA